MRMIYGTLALLAISLLSSAQDREEGFDIYFRPTRCEPRYYVATKKKDSLWFRTAWYLPERTQALEGWYRDEACTVPHGKMNRFHVNKVLQSTGTYVNGKKEGVWRSYWNNGMIWDSATYRNGRLSGIRLGWNPSGIQVDSSHFDENGNGVEVHWFEDGQPSSAGRWVSDTLRSGRWVHYYRNGNVRTTKDYQNGRLTNQTCFDSLGVAQDPEYCTEHEASFDGGDAAWRRYLERNLNGNIPMNLKAPSGRYTVIIQFIVDTNGKISDVLPVTKCGYGMEEEAIRIIKAAPRWNPARQNGRPVKAYRKQPITFSVSY